MISPKVSVIIPTFNRRELLQKAITSVLVQTYQDFELIVVDDGNDKVVQEVRSINDRRIKYIDGGTKRGGAAARNTGIKKAHGEFIAFLDDDDEWEKEKLEIQMKELEKSSDDIGFCFTAVRNITDTGEFVTDVPGDVGDYHELALRRYAGFMTSTLIIKKSVLDELGGFDEKFPSHQEPDLIIRITKKYQGIGVNKPLCRMNMRERTHINSSFDNKINGRKMIIEKHLLEYQIRPKLLAFHYFQLGLFCRDGGQVQEAMKYFYKSLSLDLKFRKLYHLFISIVKFLMQVLKKYLTKTYLFFKFFGFKYKCPFCGGHFNTFYSAGFDFEVIKQLKIVSAGKRDNVRCPRCNSSDRERMIYLYLKDNTDYFTKKCNVLHIAPEKNLQRVFKGIKNIKHISVDLASPLADKKMDILNLQFSDNYFDLVVCSHVLEHIMDDVTAMKELFRVCKTGGMTIILVPIALQLTKTLEDEEVLTETDREKVFGQSDHVRVYAMDIVERLDAAGFVVEALQFSESIGEQKIKKYSIDENEIIFLSRKK